MCDLLHYTLPYKGYKITLGATTGWHDELTDLWADDIFLNGEIVCTPYAGGTMPDVDLEEVLALGKQAYKDGFFELEEE